MSASQVQEFQELTAKLAKLSMAMAKGENASKSATSNVSVPKPVYKPHARMTKQEFMTKLTEHAKASDGKVAGGYFSKTTLPLKADGTVYNSLTDLATDYNIKVIRSDDPKQTHIYLNCTHLLDVSQETPEAQQVQAKPKDVQTPVQPVAKPRLTKAEFMAQLQVHATASGGKVHGGKFSKATLPLKDDGTVYNSLPELAGEYNITVIRDADPKKTHIYLDCTHMIPKKEQEQGGGAGAGAGVDAGADAGADADAGAGANQQNA
jgi:hypothetical protein